MQWSWIIFLTKSASLTVTDDQDHVYGAVITTIDIMLVHRGYLMNADLVPDDRQPSDQAS